MSERWLPLLCLAVCMPLSYVAVRLGARAAKRRDMKDGNR